MTLTSPELEIKRDRFDRPLVTPPGGGKPVAYTRCTTYVDAVDDKWNLQQWEKRMVATGLSMRPDLLLSVSAHHDDRDKMDRICTDAKEAAAASAKATIGTAVHKLTERIDRGLEVGIVPDAYLADLAAYTETTKDFKAVHIEKFCVLDSLKIGGTPDRVVSYEGKRFISDVKTGDVTWGIGKIAAQLSVYARSHLYDVVTGERTVHGADLEWGLIIHLPAGEGVCTPIWVNLVEGWSNVIVARDVRARRKLRFSDLTKPFAQGPVDDALVVVEQKALSIPEQIAACTTADEVRSLWTPDWTDDLNDLARNHIASLA